MKVLLGIALFVMVLMIGGALATYVFSGVLMFAGLVAMVESVPLLKWMFKKTSGFIDVLIFAFSIYGLAHMGATVSIGLSVAGLLFTLVYKPMFLKKGLKRVIADRKSWK